MIAQLIPENGGEPIMIHKDLMVVGRQEEVCDITINHKSVSKIHCVIVKTDGLLFVRDLLSTNGTRVNGQRVTRGALLPGDVLAVANAKFRVHLGPDQVERLQVSGNETQAMISKSLPKNQPITDSAKNPGADLFAPDAEIRLKESPESN